MLGKVIIAGGRGFVGAALAGSLAEAGYEVVVLSRRAGGGDSSITFDVWDGQTVGPWRRHLEGAAAVVNLAGENVGHRWTPAVKEAILNSRVRAAQAICEAIKQTAAKPGVLIQASGIGIYGSRGDEVLDEESGFGAGFLAEVGRQAEPSVQGVTGLGVRLVIARLGVVLGAGGGVLGQLLPMFSKGLGGRWGPGTQWLSWIHLRDVIAGVRYFLETPQASGVYNVVAPQPVRVSEFARQLGQALGRPALLPAPAWALRLKFGQMADELLLSSQRVHPQRLLAANFPFRFTEVSAALADILAKA